MMRTTDPAIEAARISCRRSVVETAIICLTIVIGVALICVTAYNMTGDPTEGPSVFDSASEVEPRF